MPLPVTEVQARKATRWLISSFGDAFRRAVSGTPFPVELLCGIACKETASIWLPFVAKGLRPRDVLGRCIGDASGDFPGTSRSAFPRDTAIFRGEFGDDFADMLIAEANLSRALRKMTPRGWVYKGYGLFQYDLQHVRSDEAFFRERQWYELSACLDRVIRELERKFRKTGELWAAVRAYNGSGPRAEEYREHVKVLTGWAADEIVRMAAETPARRSRAATRARRSTTAKSRTAKLRAKGRRMTTAKKRRRTKR
jgi:hypothetical protein